MTAPEALLTTEFLRTRLEPALLSRLSARGREEGVVVECNFC